MLTPPRNRRDATELIRDNVASNHPLSFHKSSELYKKNEILATQTNCYAYALGSTVPLERHGSLGDLYSKPGIISGRLSHNLSESDNDTFLRRCVEDAEFLNLPKLVGESSLEILAYTWNCYNPIMEDYTGVGGFHFMRRDSDGMYSHKPGWEDAPEKINPRLIHHSYEFIGKIVVKNSDIIVSSNLLDNEK